MEAVATIRDVIAHAEKKSKPICVLSLESRQAFDRISHHYLFQVLTGYCISRWFIEHIYALYEHATASVQINGTMAGHIPIQNAIRQGCPLSMALSTHSVYNRSYVPWNKG
jgi:hypothetical protein